MDYISHNIGINLNRIRKSKGMSLDAVSEQTGVSKSMLAQIEKGKANPSIGVIGKIVSGLQLQYDDLFSTPPMESVLIHVDDVTPTKNVPGKYRVWTLFPLMDNHFLEIYRIEIEPGEEYFSGGHGEKTKEYITVLEGTVLVKIHNGEHEITKNDAFRFEADQEHVYRNPCNVKTKFMVVFTVNR